MSQVRLIPEFVEFIPEELEAGHLYVSMIHAVAIHLCACGCNRKTVTPLSPADWKLTYDGRNVSLRPSIGNWSYPCRSHYWITDGAVRWASDMSEKEIAVMRGQAKHAKAALHAQERRDPPRSEPAPIATASPTEPASWSTKVRALWGWIRKDG
ncbi:MAG TPA: DUF6527 family protein [Luteibacter sp.]|jgi:hypothetical protein|uniref:DUF6527 family protein n=1 Tax=Luteibacter sp. TaxID=1886636 RepID=UPI002F40300B